MDRQTFEMNNTEKLEAIEWDRIWCEHSNDRDKDRVLLIGDSISEGQFPILQEILKNDIYVDKFVSSKSLDNPGLMAMINAVIGQHDNYKIIFFNNGLHGGHLESNEYEKYYENIIKNLLKTTPNVVINLTTPILDNEKVINQVKERNEAAKRIADKYNLRVCDWHSRICGKRELYKEDKVHLLDDGYRLLAQECKETIKDLI